MAGRSFSFFRAGGFDQVRFERGQDLLALGELDQKLWVALACPVKGLALDARTLELIDTDKDGRIRANELISTTTWVGGLIKNPDDLLKGAAELPLSAINDGTEEGRRVLQAAKTVLASLGKADANAISVADTAEAVKAFEATAHNGDGVVPPESAKDDASKQLAQDVITCLGSATDKSGKPGFTKDKADEFFKEVAAHAAWLDAGEKAVGTLPLKADTGPAYDALKAVRAKIDDYFARCRLAAFDPRALVAVNREEKEYLTVAAKDLTIDAAEVAGFPLSKIEANKTLALDVALNPAWAGPMATFCAKCAGPLLNGTKSLTEAQWTELKAKFAAYEAHLGAKAGTAVEKLGPERIKALAKDAARAPLDALLAEEAKQEPVAASIASVEKLVRCYRDLFRLANNFVNFREFYERKTMATFQAGTLYLDQRACELCLRVDDAGKHGTMAPLSRAYLAYCDLARPASGEKMTIAAAITAGDADNLMVGRNGIFYDRDGKDWDATVTKLVDNPISIRQAFFAPYKKLVRFVEEQVAKRAQDADSAANASLTTGAANLQKAAETGKADPAKPKKPLDVGVVAALGVAVGGITAALSGLLQSFFGLGFWMPVGVLGAVLLISGPSMLIAWLKLRQRNIGPLLDANGWAINANAKLNVPFGGSLTKTAALPPGSKVDTQDPYAEAQRPWGLYIALIVILSAAFAWYLGKLDGLLPGPAKSTHVLGENAPAAEEKAAEAKPAADAKPAEAPAAK